MSFINPEIDLSTLPAAEQMQLVPVQRSYLQLLRMEWMITAVLLVAIAAGLLFFIPSLRTSFWKTAITVAIAAGMVSYYLWQEKAFHYQAYAIREKDVAYQQGWLIRRLKICPYNRIQNCSVHTGPLERKFGLATLALFTAGSDGADVRIPGLAAEEAHRLREFILSQINGERAGED